MESKIRALEQKFSFIVFIVTSCLILVGTGIVFCITFSRYVLGVSFEWAEELLRYLIICAALIGSGPMVFNDTHICMDFFSNKIKNPRVKYYHSIFSAVCVAVFSFLLLVWGLRLSLVTNMRTYSMIFDLGTVYAMIPLSMAVIFIYSLIKLALVISAGHRTGAAGSTDGKGGEF